MGRGEPQAESQLTRRARLLAPPPRPPRWPRSRAPWPRAGRLGLGPPPPAWRAFGQRPGRAQPDLAGGQLDQIVDRAAGVARARPRRSRGRRSRRPESGTARASRRGPPNSESSALGRERTGRSATRRGCRFPQAARVPACRGSRARASASRATRSRGRRRLPLVLERRSRRTASRSARCRCRTPSGRRRARPPSTGVAGPAAPTRRRPPRPIAEELLARLRAGR